MNLIVEVEEFLKQTRCHILEASPNDTFVLVCVPRDQEAAEIKVAPLDTDDDDLITWEDAAWQ